LLGCLQAVVICRPENGAVGDRILLGFRIFVISSKKIFTGDGSLTDFELA
jgi:hypothetical protein